MAVSAGARSQLTPLVGAVSIALLLVFAPGLLRDLPLPMLAAIVITAATIGLFRASPDHCDRCVASPSASRTTISSPNAASVAKPYVSR